MSGLKEYGVYLEKGEKESLIDNTRSILDFSYYGDETSFIDHMPVSSGTFSKHENNEYNVMGIDLFFALYNVLNRSQPRYDLTNPDKYIEPVNLEDARNRRDENGHSTGINETVRRVEFSDDYPGFSSYMFTHHKLEDLGKMFSPSKESFKAWRNREQDWQEGGDKIPEDVYHGVVEEVRQLYSLDVSPDLVNKRSYSGSHNLSSATELQDLGHGEIELLQESRSVEQLTDLRSFTSRISDKVHVNEDYKDDIVNSLEKSMRENPREAVAEANKHASTDFKLSRTVERGDYIWLPDAEKPFVWDHNGQYQGEEHLVFEPTGRLVSPMGIEAANPVGSFELDRLSSILNEPL